MVGGLVQGPVSLWFGIRFITRQRAIWPYAAVPALVAAVLATTLGGFGAVYGHKAFLHYLAPHQTGFVELLMGVLALLAGLFGLLLGAILGISLAVPLSGPALERIARAVFAELNVPLPAESLGDSLATMASGLAATLLGSVLGLGTVGILTVIGALFPIALPVTLPLKLGLLALLLTWDLGDHAFACRGLRLSQRLAWMRANLGAALGFGGLASVLLCVPVLGLLVLPCGVAGAARLQCLDKAA